MVYKKFSKWNKSVPRYNEFQKMIVECITKTPSEKIDVLDLGIGKGGTAIPLLNKFTNANYEGVDNSDEAIQNSKRTLKKFKNVLLVLEDFLNFETDKRFDVIIAALSFHHLEKKDKINLLKKIKKWLKPGGIFIWGDIVKLEDEKMDKKAADYFEEYRNAVLTEEEKNKIKEHIKKGIHVFNTIDEMKHMSKAAGFKKIDVVWSFYKLTVLRIT
ncbi:MAG: methyltransferase domain-containing protein [Candidatus Pacearchaeota archaeon]